MNVTFKRNRFKRCYEKSSDANREFGQASGKKYIKIINALRSFPDLDTLKANPVYNFHRLKPLQPERYALNLTANNRLIISPTLTPDTVRVENVEDYH